MSGLTVSNSAGATSRRPSTEGAAKAAAEAPYQPGPSNPFHPALRTRSRRSMHFGRRDVVLCALTFLLAWLLFGTRGSSTSERNEYGYSYSTTLGGRPSSRVISGNRDDSGAKGSYSGSDTTDDSADVASLTGKFGKWGSKLGLAGWLGSSEAVRGHGQGDLGVEMVCEIGKDGMVKMHGYSDSVAKHPIVPSHIVDQVDADADVFDEADAPGLTRLVAHQPGWTVFENLYLSNGTLWVVTDDASSYPELRLMTSTGLPASSEPGNEEAREPTGEEIQFITPSKAAAKWGDRIWEMEGVTWLFNDGQFIDHYYHFAAELLLGMWRTYASLGRSFEPDGSTTLPAPARAWFIRMTEQTWRDKPRFNPTILWSAFPSISVLYQDDWHDIKRSTSSGQDKAYLLPRAVLADRSAAFRGQATSSTSRTVASALHVGDPGPWWWEPVRRQVLRFAGVSDDVLDISLEGYGAVNPAKFITEPDSLKEVTPPARDPLSSWQQLGMKPLVTYISRQSSRRRLTPESHADLVAALTKHSDKAGWDLNVVEAEKLTKEEQLQLAAKTTVSLVVHFCSPDRLDQSR